jgi:hypothetical protein
MATGRRRHRINVPRTWRPIFARYAAVSTLRSRLSCQPPRPLFPPAHSSKGRNGRFGLLSPPSATIFISALAALLPPDQRIRNSRGFHLYACHFHCRRLTSSLFDAASVAKGVVHGQSHAIGDSGSGSVHQTHSNRRNATSSHYLSWPLRESRTSDVGVKEHSHGLLAIR